MIKRVAFMALLIYAMVPAFATDEKAQNATHGDQDDPIGRKLSERLGDYMTDDSNHETLVMWRKKYKGLTLDERVHYCIFQLRNDSWFEWDFIWHKTPYSEEPEWTASEELIKLGRAAIPHLLGALDSRISTQIHPTKHRPGPWLVQDAAMDAIEHIACRSFEVDKLSDMGEKDRQKIRSKVAAWWEQNKVFDEVHWAKDVLFSHESGTGGNRRFAIDSLFRRLGQESYPLLIRVYHRLPKGRESSIGFDETRDMKISILQWLSEAPANNEKSVFASAVQDSPLMVRIEGAEGLWAIGDPSGLEAIVKETEDRLLKDRGSTYHDPEYSSLIYFLVRCNTPRSREAVCKCLRGRNPSLQEEAIRSIPSLRMEKAVRTLPELFDDQFILGYSFLTVSSPPRRVCDEAAETFTKVVPDAPRFDDSTTKEQQSSIDKIKRWWKENGSNLKWDEKRGILVRPATSPPAVDKPGG